MKKMIWGFLCGCLGVNSPLMANPTAHFAEENIPQIYIFVSFSMPKISLEQWLAEAKQIHAPVLLQGLIDNSFQKTTRALFELTKKNAYGVQIDPMAFERFHITAVPAVVIAKEGSCLPQLSCQRTYDVVFGNTSLLASLETIAHGDTPMADYSQLLAHRLQGKSA